MAKVKEKNVLCKTDWVQSFNLVGEAVVNDYTFKIDEKAQKSDWIYNMLNLNIECGEKCGRVSSELMGGYGAERHNVVYVHGKTAEGRDDFKNQYTIDWDDRFDESILADIGDLCFINVGLEKDNNGKTVYEKFLTPYDTIAYVKEHLEDGMVVTVRGQLRYQPYNGTLQCRKEINNIALSKAEPKDYRATFTQTMLLDKDSVTKDSIDKDRGVFTVDAYLLEKFREYNGWDLTEGGKVKGGAFVPLRKQFEYVLKENMELNVKIINMAFKVKKGVNQVTFEGEFVESGAAVQATEDDLTDEIKDLIALEMMTLEEALAKCATNGARERRMIITKPHTRLVGDDDQKVLAIQKTEGAFEEDDLVLDCLTPKVEETKEDDEVPFEEEEKESSSEDDDLAALLDALS